MQRNTTHTQQHNKKKHTQSAYSKFSVWQLLINNWKMYLYCSTLSLFPFTVSLQPPDCNCAPLLHVFFFYLFECMYVCALVSQLINALRKIQVPRKIC